MPDTFVINFKDVFFSYNGLPVLENVNFSVTKNDLICITGPNGGGKTTLLKLITGIIRPLSGRVSVLDRDPSRACPKIGYMPQHLNFDSSFPVTVSDIVMMGRIGSHKGVSGFFGWNDKKDCSSIKLALDRVGMEKLTDSPFKDLSGGQQQRTLIARAIVSEPDILLLDEPTANIDLQIQENFFDILRELNRHMTILMVSHDIGFASKIVKTVLCVNQRVVVHPTSNITGEIIEDIYNCGVRMIRHDHRCSEKGHSHD